MALREGGPLPSTAGAPDQGVSRIGPIRRSGPDPEIRCGEITSLTKNPTIGYIKVVKSIKMKPREVAPLEMLLLRAVHRTLRWVEMSSCRSSRKSEWRRLQLVHQRARRSSSCLGFLLMLDGRARCHE
jgi:hypothetical protein